MLERWRFGVVGNITHEHIGEDGNKYYGTREFSGGTKVYIDGKNWNNYPRSEIVVIGLNRFKKYEIVAVPPSLIENVRFQVFRLPIVLRILDSIEDTDGWHWWGRLSVDKREAKDFALSWKKIVEAANKNREANNLK